MRPNTERLPIIDTDDSCVFLMLELDTELLRFCVMFVVGFVLLYDQCCTDKAKYREKPFIRYDTLEG